MWSGSIQVTADDDSNGYWCEMKKGLIQIYTGSGRGKTTAAFGLALRAVGQGLSVCILQFMKPTDFETGEMRAGKKLAPGLTVKQFGDSLVWGRGKPKRATDEAMKKVTKEALEFAQKVFQESAYDVVVLDEILTAVHVNLLTLQDLQTLLSQKPASLEVVLTGRETPQELIEDADLVTEMVEVKHPFKKGMGARRGIEY